MSLLAPSRLFDRVAVLARPCPVPMRAGVYGWYFRQTPPAVPVDGCQTFGGLSLLYIGISPRRMNGLVSRQSLRSRIRYHFRGNAEGSTLRLTLGCLLADDLGIQLRRVGGGSRLTFGKAGEGRLSEWMSENALVTWIEHPEPWLHEVELLRSISVPLNLDANAHHPFWPRLRAVRADAKAMARSLPILE